MKKYKCDICGRKSFKKIKAYGHVLCSKHMHQMFNYGKFLDNNPRTQNDLNEFRYVDENTIEFDCYNQKQEVIGSFLIDAKDLEKVRYHKWRIDTLNRVVTGNCTKSRPRKELSWVIMDMEDETKVIDHIDGNPLNNKKENLRICSQGENLRNIHATNGVTGVLGVFWDRARQRYAPEIRLNYKRLHLGRYKSLEEATFVRTLAESICFKEFQPNKHKDRDFDNIPDIRKKELESYVREKIAQSKLLEE